MLMGVPFSMLLLIGSYFLLVHVLVPVQREAEGFSREIIRQELAAIGKITQAEKRVFALFCVKPLLWRFRHHLQHFSFLEGLSDTQIAILGGFLLYFLPSVTEKN